MLCLWRNWTLREGLQHCDGGIGKNKDGFIGWSLNLKAMPRKRCNRKAGEITNITAERRQLFVNKPEEVKASLEGNYGELNTDTKQDEFGVIFNETNLEVVYSSKQVLNLIPTTEECKENIVRDLEDHNNET